MRVEKELRWGEVRGAIAAITADLECAAAAPITEDLKPPPVRAPRPPLAHVVAAAVGRRARLVTHAPCHRSHLHITAHTSIYAFQLIIFAPNHVHHAAAARAHGGWRPLPAARQFAPVRTSPAPASHPRGSEQSSQGHYLGAATFRIHVLIHVLIPACARSQEMPIAGTRAHAAMLRSRLASPILQHSPARERRKLVFG